MYSWWMRRRTNIEIEEDYVEEVMRRYHLRTKTEAVDLALRRLACMPLLTKEEVLGMQGFDPDFEGPAEEPPIEPI